MKPKSNRDILEYALTRVNYAMVALMEFEETKDDKFLKEALKVLDEAREKLEDGIEKTYEEERKN